MRFDLFFFVLPPAHINEVHGKSLALLTPSSPSSGDGRPPRFLYLSFAYVLTLTPHRTYLFAPSIIPFPYYLNSEAKPKSGLVIPLSRLCPMWSAQDPALFFHISERRSTPILPHGLFERRALITGKLPLT